MIAGSALIASGLARRSVGRLCAITAGGALVWRGMTGWCSLYHALGISSVPKSPQAALSAKEGIRLEQSIEINRQPMDVYRFWRNLSNLPMMFRHLESVQEGNQGHSHWKMKGPTGQAIEWDAELIADVPGQVISWKSLEGADVANAGSVRFERTPAGTNVHVLMRYSNFAGEIGQLAARVMGESAEQILEEDLRNMKDLMRGDPSFSEMNLEFASEPAAEAV